MLKPQLEINPLLMLMLMEDYEAMGGELTNDPRYIKTKVTCITALKRQKNETVRPAQHS
jgi:hypothetical protein